MTNHGHRNPTPGTKVRLNAHANINKNTHAHTYKTDCSGKGQPECLAHSSLLKTCRKLNHIKSADTKRSARTAMFAWYQIPTDSGSVGNTHAQQSHRSAKTLPHFAVLWALVGDPGNLKLVFISHILVWFWWTFSFHEVEHFFIS